MISSRTVEYLRAAHFLNPLETDNEKDAIEKLLLCLSGHPDVADPAQLAVAVHDRQSIEPPVLPIGVALPHARTDSVKKLVMAVGLCRKPIRVGLVDVRLFLLMGVPKHSIQDYLELTSFLVRHLKNHTILDRLLDTRSMTEFVTAFAEL